METARGETVVPTHGWNDFEYWTREHLLDHTVVTEVVHGDAYRLGHLVAAEWPQLLAGKTVVDIGAHVGVFSVLCAQLGAARIVAVEPELGNLAVLRLNLALWPQVEVVTSAVGSVDGWTTIEGESGGARTGTPGGSAVEQISFRTLLGAFRINRVDLLKVDTEGAEASILLGADLSRVRRIVGESHGPKICPWVTKPRIGKIVEHLLKTHRVETTGDPDHLGYFWADRYGR